MGLLTTFSRLARECRRHTQWFSNVIENDPVLGRFSSPEDVVRSLSAPARLTPEERQEVLLAVVLAEHTSPSAVWQAILLQVLTPLLLCLRTADSRLPEATRDPATLLEVANALAQVGEGGDADRIEVRLRRLIRGSAFRFVRREAVRNPGTPRTDPLETRTELGPGTRHAVRPPADPVLRSLLDEVERAALRAIVRMRHPYAPPREIERLVRPLRRRRRRLWKPLVMPRLL
jgi:hypothetical protein